MSPLRPPRLAGDRGFTLAELLAAMAVGLLVLVAAGFAFQVAGSTLTRGADQAEAQQNARWALERMVQEIRGAGLDPRATPPTFNFTAVAPRGTDSMTTSLVLQNDFNGNGVLDPQAGCDPSAAAERVGYRLVGTELRRSTDPPTNSCEAVVVGGVQQLAFAYLDAQGTAIADPAANLAAVASVTVSVTLRPEAAGGPAVRLDDRVRLRNR